MQSEIIIYANVAAILFGGVTIGIIIGKDWL